MKKIVYIFLFFALVSNCFGQDTTKKEVYTVVETMPEFPGGSLEMMKFMQKNVHYPEDAKKKGIVGKSFVKFIVEEDGSISNQQIIKSSGNESLDKEALRVISLMPKWKPGFQKGKPVRTYFNIPLIFKL